ncbi:hypothetical protein SK803_01910 [Lentzea sp. BCCO 10_0856]|uniref:Extracellular repeat, HAF family n=1 Tax=Lentzea miocenica TaxID=3095431 RepID=A0ABU4SSR5_9PSEU|nr:hypothetical protein [Lentzea sp. BCCO 10_0856]MDX8028942.1 hypothetical protein [Lentzea sp. BCCO 10_0856]
MSRSTGFVLSAALVATVFASTPAHAATTVTEFGTLPGTTVQEAAAINDAGVTVGSATVDGKVRAVKWDSDGTVTDLGGPADAGFVRAKAINSTGAVAAETSAPGSATVALRFNVDGTHTVLSAAPGHRTTYVTGIDDSGAVYGWSLDTSNIDSWRAWRWDANGVRSELPMPAGASGSQVNAVSPNGFATGWVYLINEPTRPVRWNPDGSFTLLPALPSGGTAMGLGVNRHGDVAGYAEDRNRATFTVRWNRDGSVTQLGDRSLLVSINDNGSVIATVSFRATFWSATNEKRELPWPTGKYFGRLTGINNAGVVVGFTGDDYPEWPKQAFKWVVS